MRNNHLFADAGTTATGPADTATHAVRLVAFVIFAVWVHRFMAAPDGLLHGTILIFHEAGHVLFMPFGEFLMVLGGTLFQVMVPAFFIVYFLLRRDVFSACFAALFLAASLADAAVYIGDARAGDLPLIGGLDRSAHDWTFLLIEMNRLEQDTAIARAVHRTGVLVFLAGVFAGGWNWWFSAPWNRPEPVAAGSPPAASNP